MRRSRPSIPRLCRTPNLNQSVSSSIESGVVGGQHAIGAGDSGDGAEAGAERGEGGVAGGDDLTRAGRAADDCAGPRDGDRADGA